MLDKLLPAKLDKEKFHLTIVTCLKNDNNGTIIQNRYNKINIDINRDYEIILTIIDMITTEQNHGRYLITNYMLINPDHVFTFFNNKKANEDAVLNCKSLFCQVDTVNIVDEIIERVKIIKEEHSKQIEGTGENRLFRKRTI